MRSFYSNPGYQLGAWLGGKDFTHATDLTSFNTRGTPSLPGTFTYNPANPNGGIDVGTDINICPEDRAAVLSAPRTPRGPAAHFN